MRIVEPSVTLLRSGYENPSEFYTPEQFIELVGRTCYKSEEKITPESAPKFVRNLILREHGAMVEHWTMIFLAKDEDTFEMIQEDWFRNIIPWNDEYVPTADDAFMPKIRFTWDNDRGVISGSVRAWRDWVRFHLRNPDPDTRYVPSFLTDVILCAPLFFEDLEWGPIKSHEKYTTWLTPITVRDLEGDLEHYVHHDVTLKFICDRGVSHELVRHRAAAFAQESTRYCNYAAGKYGREISVVRPSWCKPGSKAYELWQWSCECNELKYMSLIDSGCAPQEARAVLPNSLKTEVIVTGTIGHWKHFLGLRCGPEAQPDMREVACMARDLLEDEFARKI